MITHLCVVVSERSNGWPCASTTPARPAGGLLFWHKEKDAFPGTDKFPGFASVLYFPLGKLFWL
jgi:hypothetical protein